MKKALLILCAVFFVLAAFAQAPQSIAFQAVARDTNGILLPSRTISVRITIRTGLPGGAIVYQETQTATTNNLGLFTLNIGTGSPSVDTFSHINWSAGPMYIELEADPNGGSSYVYLGTTQLQSVPYALFAGSSNGSTQPTGQIAYGNGHGLYSDGGFTRDSATGEVDLMIMPPSMSGGTYVKIDSDGFLAIHLNSTQNKLAVFGVGNPHNMAPQFDTLMIVAAIADLDSNIIYGLCASADSTELMTADATNGPGNGNYGLVGSTKYSAYLDAAYSGSASLNSFTVDSFGAHWEYNNVNQYTFPHTDGNAGQVMTTDGSGVLSWTNGANPSHTVFTPSSGDNITAIWGSNIVNPSSGLGILTITLPSSPTNNETVYFTFTNTITALYFSGGTVVGSMNTISSVSNGSVRYQLTYDTGTSSWY